MGRVGRTGAPGQPARHPARPLSITVVSNTVDLTVLTAQYPAAVLGMVGTEPIPVTLEVAGTTLLSISYASPDGINTSRTEIGPLADATPITSPSA